MQTTQTTQTIQIRQMTSSDVTAVMEIEKEAYPFPWTADIMRDCIRVGYQCWVLIDELGAVQGYAIMSIDQDGGHILNIAVRPSQQHRGYGRLLMLKLIEIAREKGLHSIFLEVRVSNYIAIKLYEHLGFNQICHRVAYYPAPKDTREDAIVYALELPRF